MRLRFLAAIASVAALSAGLSARADTLTPGESNAAPDILTLGAGSTQVGATVTGTISPGTFTASYTEQVYSDTTNTFGAGDLAFVLTFSNTGSTGIIERATEYNFAGFSTDVGYETGTGVAPSTVDESANGQVVGFNFLGSDEVNAGESSDTLIIETNATSSDAGLVSLQDGSAGSGAGLEPLAAVTPEPSSLILLGTGLLGIAGVAKRRFV